jgi:integrase
MALETKSGSTAGSIGALAETYIKHIQGLRSSAEIERRLRKDVLPVIGHIPLRELHRRDVTRVIDAKSSAPIAGRRAFEDIRGMVRWAVARGDLEHNPIDGMKGPPLSKPRSRTLTDAEIKTLWDGLSTLGNVHSKALKLCLVTGQRLGEICGIQPNELGPGRVWNIPASRTKNGYPHSVPLTDLALSLINGQVLPTRMQVSNFVMDHQFGLPNWTAHDLRRTMLTKLAELGVAPIIIGHIANHRTTTRAGITLGVYIQYAYEKEKREALELWADRLEGIISGGAKVVPIRSKV